MDAKFEVKIKHFWTFSILQIFFFVSRISSGNIL
jgi:hypothetical protein